MSMNEWSFHKFYMHSTRFGSNHIAHHKETNHDMSLNKTSAILDNDLHRGTAFHWSTTLTIFLIAIPQVVMIDKLVNRKVKHLWLDLLLVILLLTYQSIAWNTVHTKMHQIDRVQFHQGVPSLACLEGNSWLNILRLNHERHHHSKGTKCFNVTLPGADYLFGTN